MIIRLTVSLFILAAISTAFVREWILPDRSVSDEGFRVTSAEQLRRAETRAQEIEQAVLGYFTSDSEAQRRSFVRRAPYVQASLSTSHGAPSKVEEVGQLTQHDTTLTMVRARFDHGYASLLVEELPSGRFVVDSETANAEEATGWDRFRAEAQTVPISFRLYATLSEYYNFEFDPTTHLALEIQIPGSEDKATGYVRRDSLDAEEILSALTGKMSVPMILALRHPEEQRDHSQVIIDHWVQNDWVILDEAIAPHFAGREFVSR